MGSKAARQVAHQQASNSVIQQVQSAIRERLSELPPEVDDELYQFDSKHGPAKETFGENWAWTVARVVKGAAPSVTFDEALPLVIEYFAADAGLKGVDTDELAELFEDGWGKAFLPEGVTPDKLALDEVLKTDERVAVNPELFRTRKAHEKAAVFVTWLHRLQLWHEAHPRTMERKGTTYEAAAFLSTRKVAAALGGTPMAWSIRIKKLVMDGTLVVVRQGSLSRAPRYRVVANPEARVPVEKATLRYTPSTEGRKFTDDLEVQKKKKIKTSTPTPPSKVASVGKAPTPSTGVQNERKPSNPQTPELQALARDILHLENKTQGTNPYPGRQQDEHRLREAQRRYNSLSGRYGYYKDGTPRSQPYDGYL